MSTILNALSDSRVAELLRQGGVGILPTDTVYGLVCRAADQAAVARLYQIKSREHKPGTIIAAGTGQLVDLGIKARYLKAVEHFWPNSISIEIPHSLAYLSQTTGRQAFRIVQGPAGLLTLLEQVGPLLTSSANPPGQSSAGTIIQAQAYFGDTVDFYVEGGDLTDRKPSTLIRIVDDAIEVLREGAVDIDESGKIKA
ncbi:MAG TPA: L-threonylcarbamoyladenylate synthase [Candidatus Saccharimonadales bacterium]|nr:L-threonylcarbamoyladenylate synthase [Candidatus Saccharimonadales bacterium]